ncbi:MAG: TlpA family protein disulfide reductase [Gammaproteobacteria bacterium]|nr:TlpA family protein disulfide reductase [Gammaproteobacteria bacterium]
MTRNQRLWIGFVVLGLGAAVLGFSVARYFRATSVEKPATAASFSLRDLSGKVYTSESFRGKLVLLNFWATWCPPCRREIPLFMEAEKRYRDRGLAIVGISIDSPDAVARYWQEMRINYTLLLADDDAMALMAAYGNPGGVLPYSVLIRPDGTVASAKLGPFAEKELTDLIEAQLPTPQAPSR